MARKTLRRLIEKPLGSEWERLLRGIRRRDSKRFLVFWNRGLGDIALGLCRVIDELRRAVPDAEITVLTRSDLAEAFGLLPIDHVLVDRKLERDDGPDLKRIRDRGKLVAERYDLIIAKPDPTHWFRDQANAHPRLHWPERFNAKAAWFDPLFDTADGPCIDIGVHVHSETASFYRYQKDWPVESWRALFDRVRSRHPARFVLFGHSSDVAFGPAGCIDLRGRTSFLEMMALIKNRCRMLIAPDSGVLTMTYYLDTANPIDIVSLWADPRQGILKQGAPSPNPLLRHHPLLAQDERIEHIDVDTVAAAVDSIFESAVDWPTSTPKQSIVAVPR